MKEQEVIHSKDIALTLSTAIENIPHDRLFVLTDSTTHSLCWPLIQDLSNLRHAQMICIGANEENKTLENLAYVWTKLQQGKATRHSLMLNLGGGMITDLGGFAASTFKRGLPYINIPTTLLSMVDAAVGGKTGINFGGLKNEIGVFNNSQSVILDSCFLRTLNIENLLSGYAEMLKHGLISNAEHWNKLLKTDFQNPDYETITNLAIQSVDIKKNIVNQDPTEKGIRKALNLGHTVGHAFESLALHHKQPILHGYAVAWGLICELYLSTLRCGFPQQTLRQATHFIRAHYGLFPISCKQYDQLYTYMCHDKKNQGTEVNFTLLSNIGNIHINQTASKAEILEMLDFFRETN